MSGVGLNIQSDDIRDLLFAIEILGGEMAGDEAKLIAGTQLKETVRDHLFALENDSVHHRTAQSFGAPITHFYSEAAGGVHDPQLEGGGVSVSIESAGLAQRYFGGDIEGDPFLTIPARTEAVGHRARDFANLRLIIFPSGSGALVERDATVLRGGKRGTRNLAGSLAGQSKGDSLGGLVFFWLLTHVHQEPDPTVLPTDEQMTDPIVPRLQSYFERIWDERNAA
jgi:hypothetical protein